MEHPILLRYAETDDDVIAIHRFLLVVAKPVLDLLAPVDIQKSLIGVIQVVKDGVAVMAIRDGLLIGTIGLVKPDWWFSSEHFLTDRWNFVLPQERNGEAGRLLEAEAEQIADAAGLKWVNQGKARPKKGGNKILMMPRVHAKSDIPNQLEGA